MTDVGQRGTLDLLHMEAAPGTPMMRLHTYVREGGQSIFTKEGLGAMNLVGVMVQRPPDYRYAVVEIVPGPPDKREFWLIDMLDCSVTDQGQVIAVGWHKSFPSPEVAIMAASMIRRT